MLEAISSTAITAGQAAASRITETQTIAPSATSPVQAGDDVGFDSVMKQVTTDAIGTLKAGESGVDLGDAGQGIDAESRRGADVGRAGLADRGRGPRQGRAGLPRSRSYVDLI